MGEVYRADDLKLRQPVALKFLPKDLVHNAQRHEYFHNEVRLSRQISHPNVCRVYDIAEVDGQHYLSMEFIDGEDLKELLRRIGRLPKDKGLEIARQLCAGLAAAHEKGVLHCDLKPANVMIDGRGQARITDFGLARLTGDQHESHEIPGTPAYMAPEQFLHGQMSVRSDLYALGLVLYEIFTGRRAHQAGSLAELQNLHSHSSTTRSPSDLVDDMDPVVERVILRCLEKDPDDRPRSAASVAAALPGGDPLAAAIAAGETPSPEMVAAAGERGGVSPTVAGACLAGVVGCLVVACLLADRAYLVNRAPLERPPEALEDEAKEIVEHLGYDEPPAQTACGFVELPIDRKSIQQAELPDGVGDRWDLLETGPWPGMRFWYRQSSWPMLMNNYWTGWGGLSRTRVTDRDPPWVAPRMVGVALDPRGRLRGFRAVPPKTAAERIAKDAQSPKWADWFPEEYLGFSLGDLATADWQLTPPDAYDTIQSWQGTWPGSGEPLYVQATAYRGRPVHFAIIPPLRMKPEGLSPWAASSRVESGRDFLLWLVTGVFVGAAVLAWWNLQLGRGDRRGAARLALYVFGVGAVVWILQASHTGGAFVYPRMMVGLSQAAWEAARFWIFYIALEPWVRRIWPETLISWTRLLAGRFRDPRIGRDLLVGALVGAIIATMSSVNALAPGWLGLPWELKSSPSLSLLGPAVLTGQVLAAQLAAIANALFVLTLLLLFRVLFRGVTRDGGRLAGCGVVVVMVVWLCLMEAGHPYVSWLVWGLNVTMLVWLLVRFGLLAAVSANVVIRLLQLPITTDTSAFYFGNGLFAVGLVLAIAMYGFYTSLAGRPVFAEALPE